MSNLLKMANVQSILLLYAQGWSQRRIARELRLDRETVRKYVRQGLCDPKPANVLTGSADSKPATLPSLPGPGPKPANLPTGSASAASSRSKCLAHRETILAKREQGLSAQRIYQDLGGAQAGFSYDSVRRFMRRQDGGHELPVRRVECQAGEEAQVDFGSGARIQTADGRGRKTNVFRIVLSHSRKAYSEACCTQTTDDFLRCLENAFAYFGGVPKKLVIDNLKAAVAHPDWFDPEITPKVQSFAAHYGTVILPTKPYTPQHKGKVESGIKYVKNNALKGRTFTSLAEQNAYLAEWERSVADTRIHGTTKQQVGKQFAEVERAALLPLPPERFSNFHEAQRKVSRDGHVEVAKAYYSTPPEYLRRTVWVRWDARLVRIFNTKWEPIAVHVRHEPGRFSTQGEHLHPHKINGLEQGAAFLLDRVELIGSHANQWAQAMLHARGIAGTRVLQGILSLTKKHDRRELDKACEIALSHGVYRLKTIRKLLAQRTAKQLPLAFLEEHPIIRPLEDYAQVVARAIHRQADRPSVGEGFMRSDSGVRRAAENENSPGEIRPGCEASSTRPRSGSPLSGCSSAEPDSVSPDSSTVVPVSPFRQELLP